MHLRIFQLHKAYGKHALKLLGEGKDGAVYYHCSCGIFACKEDRDDRYTSWVAGLARAEFARNSWGKVMARQTKAIQKDWASYRLACKKRKYCENCVAEWLGPDEDTNEY